MVPTGPGSDRDLNQNKARGFTGASPAAGVSGVSSSNTNAALMIPAVAIDLRTRPVDGWFQRGPRGTDRCVDRRPAPADTQVILFESGGEI